LSVSDDVIAGAHNEISAYGAHLVVAPYIYINAINPSFRNYKRTPPWP